MIGYPWAIHISKIFTQGALINEMPPWYNWNYVENSVKPQNKNQKLGHYAKLKKSIVDSQRAACGRSWCSYKCERYISNLAIFNTPVLMDELSLWVLIPL